MVTGEKTISYLLDNLLCFSKVRSVKYEVGTIFFGYGHFGSIYLAAFNFSNIPILELEFFENVKKS